eukprot:scaffold23203_cov20-Tisochrysis_lutea.AAC.1
MVQDRILAVCDAIWVHTMQGSDKAVHDATIRVLMHNINWVVCDTSRLYMMQNSNQAAYGASQGAGHEPG